MSDVPIPKDIRETAWRLAELAANEYMELISDGIAEAIAAALMAERERCAKIADDTAVAFVGGPAATIYGQGYQAGCKASATAIRRGTP